MLLLFIIGFLLIMTGCSGGGLWFLVPGIVCIVVASVIYVRQDTSS